MSDLSLELQRTVDEAAARLLNISDTRPQTASLNGQWSARQILGHLIDSAADNHQRFVRAVHERSGVPRVRSRTVDPGSALSR